LIGRDAARHVALASQKLPQEYHLVCMELLAAELMCMRAIAAAAIHPTTYIFDALQVNNSSGKADQQQQQQQQSKGFADLLSSLGVLELSKLLAGASQLGLQQPLMDQLARLLQVRPRNPLCMYMYIRKSCMSTT
jgi:hypothetical protein